MVFVIFVSFFLLAILCCLRMFIALFFQKWSQIMCIRASKVQWRYLFAFFLSIVAASFRYIFVCMYALLYMLIANKWIIFKSKVELHSNYWLVDAVPTFVCAFNRRINTDRQPIKFVANSTEMAITSCSFINIFSLHFIFHCVNKYLVVFFLTLSVWLFDKREKSMEIFHKLTWNNVRRKFNTQKHLELMMLIEIESSMIW